MSTDNDSNGSAGEQPIAGSPAAENEDHRRWLTTAQTLRAVSTTFAEWVAAINDMLPIVDLQERVALERERLDLQAVERQIRAKVRRAAYRQAVKHELRRRARAKAESRKA